MRWHNIIAYIWDSIFQVKDPDSTEATVYETWTGVNKGINVRLHVLSSHLLLRPSNLADS